MKTAFSQLFWGFFLVLFEVFLFVIDILPEPVGYYFIYAGLDKLSVDYPIAKKGRGFALVMLVISIPTVFHQNTPPNQEMVLSMWSMYMLLLLLLKLILVYYVFQTMVEIAQKKGGEDLQRRTETTFKAYFIIMFPCLLIEAFSINFVHPALIVITIVAMLIMEIIFLILLRNFRKIDDDNEDLVPEE